MGILGKIFTWWNGATIGTALWSSRNGTRVGEDHQGNVYFQGGKDVHGHPRRWVMYAGANDASRVPPEWHGWLHHTVNQPPTHMPLERRDWETDHTPNMTGTPYAVKPKGSVGASGVRQKSDGDYEAWTPDA